MLFENRKLSKDIMTIASIKNLFAWNSPEELFKVFVKWKYRRINESCTND